MTRLTLILGNKNFSSWSMRGWLALKCAGLEFEERTIWIDEDSDRTERLRYSGAGRVPVLLANGLVIWDSLAIAEWAAEENPEARFWPADRSARTRARSIVYEMHSGFADLRENMPMNCRARKEACDRGEGTANDVRRVIEIWEDTRRELGAKGPFLFGERCLADLYFAPVASRFRTYSIELSEVAAEYARTLLEMPEVREWMELAGAETHEIEEYALKP